MILTCPDCSTQYVVKDGAIPAGGRQVRCASCKHSWHQDADEPETLALQPEQQASHENGYETEAEVPEVSADPQEDADSDDRSLASDDDPVAAPEHSPSETGWHDQSPMQEDEFAPFGPRDYGEEPKRSALKPLLMLIVLVAAAAIAFWFLATAEWKAKVGLAQAAETPLQLMMTHSDRQPLESGNELLAVTGRVINPTDRPQRVPPIQAQLRSNSGRIVYSWTIAPPAPSLAPGASATFNSAEVNVPAGGDQLTLTLDAPRA